MNITISKTTANLVESLQDLNRLNEKLYEIAQSMYGYKKDSGEVVVDEEKGAYKEFVDRLTVAEQAYRAVIIAQISFHIEEASYLQQITEI